MKRKLLMLIMTVGLAALFGTGCLEDKTLEIVLTGETSADFIENEDGADEAEIAIVDVADQLREILEDNGYDTGDISAAHMTSVSYGVTSFAQMHDWVLTGTISVRRVDTGPTQAVLVNYASQSVQAALGQKIAAPLEEAGVDIVNAALADFLDGQSPVLEFEVVHGTIDPLPSGSDPMVFDWRAWLAVQLILDETVEVPDPF